MMIKPRQIIVLMLIMAALSIGQTALGQSAPTAQEWTQDAHDAQRTGYTLEEPLQPWQLLWTWNGPDANGGASKHFYNAPREARTVTGGAYVYVPAGGQGLYALSKQNGSQAWNVRATSFNAAPAYDPTTGYLYANGADGNIYKIDSRSGNVVQRYNAGNPLNKAVLLVTPYVYAVTDNGQLHKVNTADMTRVWVYSGNAAIATPPAYSPSRDVIVYATNDLYVHAVNNNNGSAKWRVKPTPNPAGFPNEFDGYWPVIAEKHGVVFLRMRLNHDAGLWGGPGRGGIYPNTNAETRTHLQSKPQLKNLFVLSLDNGGEAFIPAVGYGGVEDLVNGSPYLDLGPVPVVRVLPNGQEVAYQIFRSGQSNPPDGRWDSHLGEMVLDNQTVPGLVAGDLRFIQFPNSPIGITDEQTPLSMAGETIFNAHWGASESARITDRSNSLGLTYGAPIKTQRHPFVIRRMIACNNFNAATHWTTCNLGLFGDTRMWPGAGWWVYWNVLDPPTVASNAYSGGILPRYTYVSDGLVIVQGNGGDLFVLKHSGRPLASPTGLPPTPAATTAAPTSTPRPTNTLQPPTMTPTFTPTATLVAPTATVPPTSTPVAPTGTAVPPTQPSIPRDTPSIQINVSPVSGGASLDVTFNLVNVTNLYGLQAVCTVDPAALAGAGYTGGDGFNDANSFLVDTGYNAADGSWMIGVTRIRPYEPISGSMLAFKLSYSVLQPSGSMGVNCAVQGVDVNGADLPLEIVTVGFDGRFNTPLPPTQTTPVAPSATPTATVVVPTATAGALGVVSGTANYPGRTDHAGIKVSLYALDTLLAEVTTTSSGAYQFTDVPVGVYFLRLSAPQSLTLEQQVLVENSGQVVDLGVDLLPMGDTDSSGAVDLVDASFIGANYGNDGTLAPNGDLTADSLIDINDLVLVGNSFGLTSPVVEE